MTPDTNTLRLWVPPREDVHAPTKDSRVPSPYDPGSSSTWVPTPSQP